MYPYFGPKNAFYQNVQDDQILSFVLNSFDHKTHLLVKATCETDNRQELCF